MSNRDDQAAYKRRQREKGLQQVTLWVPKDRAHELRFRAAQMVSHHELKLAAEERKK